MITCPNCQKPVTSPSAFCPWCGASLTGSLLPGGLTGRLAPGHLLSSRYLLMGMLGQGGMGAVYKAEDQRINGRFCAIKEMSEFNLPPAERIHAAANFKREAELLAHLNHPNLPQVSDYFQDGSSGRHYLVMDFIEGQTLEELLNTQGNRPFAEATVRDWGIQLCEVLAYLHSQPHPVIFRDLKPANIMLDKNGRLKLIDFGIARLFQSGRSQDTQAFGTPGYAPPEQFGHQQTDARSDVYSLGVTLLRLATGYDPSPSPFQLPAARQLNPTLSAGLEAAIRRATQLEPNERFQTMADLKATLENKQAPRSLPFPKWLIAAGVIALMGISLLAARSFFDSPAATATAAATTASSSSPGVAAVLTAEPSHTSPTATETTAPRDTATPRPPATATDPPAATNTPTRPPATSTPRLPATWSGEDGVTMVLVPAGNFLMGSTLAHIEYVMDICRLTGSDDPCGFGEFSNEMPQHTIYLDAYYIDQTEITNDQYRACVGDGICDQPDTGSGQYSRSNYYNNVNYGNHPVVNVSWFDARDYCLWAGERLPTEAEWEKAARGPNGQIFPWGDQFYSNLASTEETGDQTYPVGGHADNASPYGALDMSGNVWEWVQDWFNADYYGVSPDSNPPGAATGSEKVLRGGSYSDYQSYARTTNRGFRPPDTSSAFRGFRCAISASEVQP
jgi:formylglycine-generating enzyme required for sulfatase activity